MAKKKQSTFKKYVIRFWIIVLGGFLSILLFFMLASWGVFGALPTFEELENPEKNIASQIISADGVTLGKYFYRNRTPIGFKELPDNLVKALVATEDERFYEHSGIDFRGTARAVVKLGKGGGASTITQQLAKNLFTKRASSNPLKRIIQKSKEWVVAIKLERQYTKNEIMAMYLNTQDFLFQAIGIRSAARIYFGKEPNALDLKESAMLVGMFKNSSLYNPRRNPEGVTNRRNVVFAQMSKYEYITEQARDSLQQLPLDLNYTPESHNEGIATYFREYLRGFLKEWVDKKENRRPDGEKYNIYKDGLKIYTTIDSRMQRYAEAAVAQHMPRLQAEFDNQNTPKRNPTAPFLELKSDEIEDLLNRGMRRSERWRVMKKNGSTDDEIKAAFNTPTQMSIFRWEDGLPSERDTIMTPLDSMRYYKSFLHPAMMSMEPQTGHVKAWVGGMNYKHFQYDMVKQGKRQIGSTFKPFVYATAIDQLHLSPCDTLPDTPFCIEKNKYGNPEEWCPKNSGGEYGGTRTLKNALANSVNTITARLMDKVGPQPVIDLANKLGVEQEILAVPSIALGTPDLSVYEMVAAYSTFANQGVYTKPVLITHIEDKNGTILYQVTPETKDVLSAETAYVTVQLLEGVTQGGSGTRLRHKWAATPVYKEIITGYPYEFTNPIAGKTGTTQNQSDGWFMGMVPNLVTGVWVGAEDRAAHFSSITYGQGASMALPIWALYMKACYTDNELNVSQDEFVKPENLSIEVDCLKYNEEQQKNKDDDDLDEPEIDF